MMNSDKIMSSFTPTPSTVMPIFVAKNVILIKWLSAIVIQE